MKYINKKLTIEKVSVQNIAKKYLTPTYCYSYNKLKESYYESLNSTDLTICPDYWGGYSLTPYYFEFWEGHQSRLNIRETFDLQDGQWIRNFLQA